MSSTYATYLSKLFRVSLLINTKATEGRPKKDARRIHWADNSGKALAVAEGGEEAEPVKNDEPKKKKRKSRWAERKKKDIQHEKELLLQSRKPPTLDKDLDDELDAMAMMVSSLVSF